MVLPLLLADIKCYIKCYNSEGISMAMRSGPGKITTTTTTTSLLWTLQTQKQYTFIHGCINILCKATSRQKN
jgi:hypothetical protein